LIEHVYIEYISVHDNIYIFDVLHHNLQPELTLFRHKKCQIT